MQHRTHPAGCRTDGQWTPTRACLQRRSADGWLSHVAAAVAAALADRRSRAPRGSAYSSAVNHRGAREASLKWSARDRDVRRAAGAVREHHARICQLATSAGFQDGKGHLPALRRRPRRLPAARGAPAPPHSRNASGTFCAPSTQPFDSTCASCRTTRLSASMCTFALSLMRPSGQSSAKGLGATCRRGSTLTPSKVCFSSTVRGPRLLTSQPASQ